MRYSLLLPMSLLALSGCVVAGPAPRPTTTVITQPATSTTYSTTTPGTLYSPPTQTTTTTVRPGY